MTEKKTIVVSGVNIRKGGTLTIMRSCLRYLSGLAGQYNIVAIVHDSKLYDFPEVEYIEIPWSTRSWGLRLWCEYVTMHRLSLEIAERYGSKVHLWLSMHDTTPRVEAEHQEVYCHTSFPFMKIKLHDFLMDPKIPLFSMFTRWAYRINVHRNDSLIVQQEWFKDALSSLIGVPADRFHVIPPTAEVPIPALDGDSGSSAAAPEKPDGIVLNEAAPELPTFLYASTPDCHKNFETLCGAAALLEKKVGQGRFKVLLTIKGDENGYARWLKKKWGGVGSIQWGGFMSRETLFGWYRAAAALVFPSRVETWGLPISEFMTVNGFMKSGVTDGAGQFSDPGSGQVRMLLADLPYAHETSGDSSTARFFAVSDQVELCRLMEDVLRTCSEYERKFLI